MKSIIIALSVFLVAAVCVPLDLSISPSAAESDILKQPPVTYEEERNDEGEYSLHYVTADGTEVYEKGWLVANANGTDKVLIVEGSYSYLSTDGKRYTTKYRSDIPGAFQPEGEHLPKPPQVESK